MGSNNQKQSRKQTRKTQLQQQQQTPETINVPQHQQITNNVMQREDPQVSLNDKYEIGSTMLRGRYSSSKIAINKATSEQVVLKYSYKRYMEPQDVTMAQREFDSMKDFHHPNVIKYLEFFDLGDELVFVIEYANAGDLFSYVLQLADNGSYTEVDVRNFIRQIVEAVSALNERGIFITELKPKHILCHKTTDGEIVVKLSHYMIPDFWAGSVLEASCGTPLYAAPELLRMDSSTFPCASVWCIGIIAYTMLCGYPPFFANSHPRLFEKILTADYDFSEPEWDIISLSAKDFIRKAIVDVVERRATIAQCLEHEWMKGVFFTNNDVPSLYMFCIKAITKHQIAYHHLVPGHLEETLDEMANGLITTSQAQILLRKHTYMKEYVREIYDYY